MICVTFTRQAQRDLEEIHDYVAEHNPDSAGRVMERLERACKVLGAFPGAGRARHELGSGLCSVAEGNYAIFYLVDAKTQRVDVLRVLHGARDLPSLFHNYEEI